MPVIGSLVSHLHLAPHAALAASFVAMFGINIPAALFIHRFAEVPLMKYLKKRRQRPAEGSAPFWCPRSEFSGGDQPPFWTLRAVNFSW